MGQVIHLKGIQQARHRRDSVSMEECVGLLEWNLKTSLDQYFSSPPEEKSMRATQIRKLSEILEYALRLV
ncbi:MAG TPA: hypothetical protein VKH64_10325 [Candidatus Binatia bacterium]|nr:hypothetical protein [Candidatus Binatia bacterium]